MINHKTILVSHNTILEQHSNDEEITKIDIDLAKGKEEAENHRKS
jgi:hypothetical protein